MLSADCRSEGSQRKITNKENVPNYTGFRLSLGPFGRPLFPAAPGATSNRFMIHVMSGVVNKWPKSELISRDETTWRE